MSRSIRKTAVIKDNGKHKRFYKKIANKKVRKTKIGNNGNYKKCFESWNICDWKFWIKNKCKKNLSK